MKKIPRREFLKTSGALGAAYAAWPLVQRAPAETPETTRRPNLLVFLTDDHGQWAQQAYGNSELLTPNMDRLAARGTRMTQAFTTCPVCSPARASFFTGRMPSQHGIHDWLEEKKDAPIHPGLKGQTLISELLQQGGYHTGLVGKWHCGMSQQIQPGFDYWFSYWINQFPHVGKQQFSNQGKLEIARGQQSPLLTDRALEFLRQHRSTESAKEKPFFLFVSYVDPHNPHSQAPEDLVHRYGAATFRDIPVESFAPCHGKAIVPAQKNPQAARKMQMEYYGAVSSVDREVGRVLAELDAGGEMDNTLIVYTSDHGLNAGHHGLWEKGNATVPQNFLEESTRVSCTVSWPAGGIRRNATCEDFVSHPDLWATLLDVAGASPDAKTAAAIHSPGVSYLPQLRGQTALSWRKTMISEYGNARMARTDRYKLIRRYPYKGVNFPDELYDLQADPRETVNRHQDAGLQPVVDELSSQIDRFFADYTVPGHSGLDLEHQPECSPVSPWIRAVKLARAPT
jgi:arylsulfatase A-like enzyme